MVDQESKAPPNKGIPAGTGDYVVEAGECIASIAYEHGHFWETIFNHRANQELKFARENHHILFPGDRLTIPPICSEEHNAVTDVLHRFELKGVTEVFQMRLLDAADRPRANLRYVLVIEQKTFSGITNAAGKLEQVIPPNARQGRLIVFDGHDTEEIELRLGDLDPITTTSGAQARLTNLALDCGAIDGKAGTKTRKAIRRFQKSKRLDETGELDGPTLRELEASHGC